MSSTSSRSRSELSDEAEPRRRPPALPVALDAMGGDRAPGVVIEGAIQACEQGLGPITLVGDEAAIRRELERRGPSEAIGAQLDVVAASEVIAMAEHPGRAARTKRDSSIHVGFRLVRERRACGFVSAGNSGAMMATGLLTLRRIPGCERPAIAGILPTGVKPCVLLDMGANVECRASHLVQFALMGAAFAEVQVGVERPTVALLSNGVEPNKGTEALREAHRLLTTTSLNYLGYLEGGDLTAGVADVVVTDGFVGNVVLKVSEGVVGALFERIRERMRGDWRTVIGATLVRRALDTLRSELDWSCIGAAPLLGIDGVALVAHGRSPARAIAGAVRLAREHVEVNLVERLKAVLEQSNLPPDDQLSTAELPLTRASGAHEKPERPS